MLWLHDDLRLAAHAHTPSPSMLYDLTVSPASSVLSVQRGRRHGALVRRKLHRLSSTFGQVGVPLCSTSLHHACPACAFLEGVLKKMQIQENSVKSGDWRVVPVTVMGEGWPALNSWACYCDESYIRVISAKCFGFCGGLEPLDCMLLLRGLSDFANKWEIWYMAWQRQWHDWSDAFCTPSHTTSSLTRSTAWSHDVIWLLPSLISTRRVLPGSSSTIYNLNHTCMLSKPWNTPAGDVSRGGRESTTPPPHLYGKCDNVGEELP